MGITRRKLLKNTAAIGAAAGLAGCSNQIRDLLGNSSHAPIRPLSGRIGAVMRVIDRTTFGPTPELPETVSAMGIETFVHQQLNAALPMDDALKLALARLDIFCIDSAELRDLPEGEIVNQLKQAALLRAVFDPNQLQERMVDFWSNHFNIYARKRYEAWRKPTDDVEVIRKHALGSFPNLLYASAKSPAMLEYLDNDSNKAGTANENYARELMELHTLGVDGGYTQRDVQEVARCFTGWTIENRFLHPRGTFRFDESVHDDQEKTVLGQRIPPGGGISDGERVLEILAFHPSTARHIAKKLCTYFLGESDNRMVENVSQTYLQTHGDIKSILKTVLLSKALMESPPIVKRPFDFVASALRAVDANSDCGRAVQKHLDDMGQSIFEWPMPDGFPVDAASWSGSLLARWNFASELAFNRIPGTNLNLTQLKQLSTLPLVKTMRQITLGLREGGIPTNVSEEMFLALCLSSPEFQWR